MSNVTCKVKNTTKPVFKPVTIVLEITLESREEVNNMRREFSEGTFEDYPTEYSEALFNVLNKLEQISYTL